MPFSDKTRELFSIKGKPAVSLDECPFISGPRRTAASGYLKRAFPTFTRRLIPPVTTVLGLALMASLVCCQAGQSDKPLSKVVVGSSTTPYSALLIIAKQKGFAAQNGIELDIRRFDSGLDCVRALAKEELDVATVADFPFVSVLRSAPLRIIASIALLDTIDIIARKDRGVLEPRDLRGKRIGYSPDTTTEYYLGNYLISQAIRKTEVTLVPVAPAQVAESLATGQVDAAVVWDVNSVACQERLGELAVTWPAQTGLDSFLNLAIRQDFIDKRAPDIEALLRSLLKAEKFLASHGQEAKGIVADYWGLKPETFDQHWTRANLTLSLEQSLLLSLESAAKFRLQSGHDAAATMPNMLDFVYRDPMMAVAPKRVTLYR